jgi:low affinity Fe/Cu permease
MQKLFHRISLKVSRVAGAPMAFLTALSIVIIWAIAGPFFHYSNTWQLLINTGTTIGTFLMVFLIQNTQNRDGKEVHLKLDELIRSGSGRDFFLDLNEVSDDELEALDQEFHEIYEKHKASGALKKLHVRVNAEHKRRRKV